LRIYALDFEDEDENENEEDWGDLNMGAARQARTPFAKATARQAGCAKQSENKNMRLCGTDVFLIKRKLPLGQPMSNLLCHACGMKKSSLYGRQQPETLKR
jgi:hypothetical protein